MGRGVASKWLGKTKKYSNGSKKWVDKNPYSIIIRQKSGWARAHPAYPAPMPLKPLEYWHAFERSV